MGDFEHDVDRVEDADEISYINRPSVHRTNSDLLRSGDLLVIAVCHDGIM